MFINLGEPGGFDITPWADRVQLINAEYGPWELPALGTVTAPTARVIRPDEYVVWVGDRTQLTLSEALITWFGLPAPAECTGSLCAEAGEEVEAGEGEDGVRGPGGEDGGEETDVADFFE